MKNYEIEGFKYENFLKRFYKFDGRLKRPHKSELINLIDAEEKSLENFEKDFKLIIQRLHKALDILEEKELRRTMSSSNLLPVLYSMLDKVENTGDINRFLDFALSQTELYR